MKKYFIFSFVFLATLAFGAPFASAQNAPYITISASPTSVAYNGTTTISYTVTSATSCQGSQGSLGWYGAKSTSGGSLYTTPLTATTTYVLTCTNSYGAMTKSVTVVVNGNGGGGNQNAPTVTISANPTWVSYNGSSTISWNSTNASSCSASGGSNGWTGSQNTSGSFYASSLTSTTTYSLTCTNSYGTTTQTVTVSVQPYNPPQGSAPVVTVSANPTSVSAGGATTISWSATNNPSACYINGWPMGASGSKVYYPTSTTTYTVSCTNSYGTNSNTVTVYVTQTPPPTPNPTVNISANPSSISSGSATNIIWNTTNATSCNATGGSSGWAGAKNPNGGSYFVSALYTTTTFTITCTNGSSTATDSVTVGVVSNPVQNPLPSVTITADQIFLPYNGTTYIRWYPSNATACQAYGGANGWAGSKSINGGSFFSGQMTQNATYKIICYNSSGQSEDSVTVAVDAQPVQNPSVTLVADQTSLAYGQGTYLRWSVSNATACNASGGTNNWYGSKNISGGSFYTGALSSGTKTYTLTCTNSTGSASDSETIYVGGQSNQDPTIRTDSASNISNNSATLNGYLNVNGNTDVFSGFVWGVNSNLTNFTALNTYSSNTTLSYYLTGLQENTTYSFQAITEDDYGNTIYGEVRTFRTLSNNNGCTYNCGGYNYDRPSVTTYSATDVRENAATLNGYVDNGNGYNTTRWFEYGTNYGALYNSTNHYSQAGNYGNFGERVANLSPNTTYYFRAVAQNNNGTAYGNVMSFTTTTQYYYNNCGTYGTCAPQAVTTIATSIGSVAARLNGIGVQDTNVVMTGYFEYGLTQSLGQTTTSNVIGSATSNPFNSSIYTLAPNTTYYYRAVVSTQYGVARGDIQTFRTNNVVVVNNTNTTRVVNTDTTRTVVTNTSVNTNVGGVGLSKPSLVFLTIDRNGEVINIGEEITYNIYYKNVSTKDLRDVVLRVALPKELSFVSSSRGYWSEENNTVVVNIGNLLPGEEGSMRVTALVTRSAEVGKITVVTANIAYTINEDGSQEEVFAYSKNNIEDNRNVSLTGNALFGAGFWPTTLAGWLILLLLILLIILIIRLIYVRMFPARTTTTTMNPGGTTTTTFHH